MIIREGIRDSVDWDSLHLEVVGEGSDGEEALELAVEHKVDILLVDLNMPIMNGMTLIKHIRKELPKCRVVIITGHDEFAYAQQAIRLHVDDYITKPIIPDQLKETLIKVCEKLHREEEAKSQLTFSSKQVKKNVTVLREKLCVDWISGRISELEILEQLEFLELPVSVPDYISVIRWPEMDAKQPLLTENDRKLTLFAIENIISEWFEDNQKVILRDENGLIIVIVWGKVADNRFNDLAKAFQTYLKITVYQHIEWLSEKDNLSAIGIKYKVCKEHVYERAEISQLVHRAEAYMYENYQNSDLNLEVLAETLHVSPVYLSRLMKQDLGISFVAMLTNIRINKAIQLLNTTNFTINEISEMVGYDTQHYFSTSFKKVVGVSPKQYRNGKAFSSK
ncbi:response regulator [Bacillus tamaricis]|uniref:Response regulator n=2 Tax=Evansella tamaricis TaxID=2069301 RepID=A0ABS6JFY9_9BACI|nr:response regulator [Evansella tamaricis]